MCLIAYFSLYFLTLSCTMSVVFVVPCDQQWSHEKVREFCMQVRFMQYEMRKQQEMKALNLKDCDINGFLHIFKVR